MQTLIAANWKMNKSQQEAEQCAKELVKLCAKKPLRHDVVLFAPFTALSATKKGLGKSGFHIGAQNFYPAENGAFTGEIAPSMLKDAGATWVLIGHSERRHILGESSAFIAQKTAFAQSHGLHVMLCVGETLDERKAGSLEHVMQHQLNSALQDLQEFNPQTIVIAYEPVWAIGTGNVASQADIVEAHALLRALLSEQLGSIAAHIRLLYGGSVTAQNAPDILALDNVNGLLVGGASLQAKEFASILSA